MNNNMIDINNMFDKYDKYNNKKTMDKYKTIKINKYKEKEINIEQKRINRQIEIIKSKMKKHHKCVNEIWNGNIKLIERSLALSLIGGLGIAPLAFSITLVPIINLGFYLNSKKQLKKQLKKLTKEIKKMQHSQN